MKKKELIEILRALLIALVDKETPPPKPPPPPVPPTGYTAYIKADGALCCGQHDVEFERSTRVTGGGIRFLPFR